ncbi:unnamed protein product [Jaminaea pallidilutea]
MGLPPFPTEGLLPKDATGALKFIEDHPSYDGRKVRVGILDTGVDPAARGLDGKGKVVDVIDCTGTGDVPLISGDPTKSKVSNSGAVEVISPTTGRKLLLDPAWVASGQLLLGFKRAYELWPKDLVARRKLQRKKNWDVEVSKVIDRVQRRLADLEAGDGNGDKGKNGDQTASEKQELKAQLSVLTDLNSSYNDPGPLLEVVTFKQGEQWKTVVGGAEGDIRESTLGLPDETLQKLEGQSLDLRGLRPLADFHLEQEHNVFGPADLLTYTVNHIFEASDESNPSAVSLVTLSGSHGTHVAGITGAHLPDSPEENGVAPGVEIVSLKIGDTRVEGMETAFALLRAAQAAIATRCDILNMSFGEDGAFLTEGKGAFAEALRDVVIRQKDILFVSSAGNSAPALTTLGQPAGTTEGVFTIGAYVTAGSMQEAQYALVEGDVGSSATTWSSRGPAADGAKGVIAWAPGAAITSIPKYCLSKTQLMNGTSMASPNACGCISLLLSGMKQEGIPITSARVYKAIEATARDIDDELKVGFVQVDKAWQYIIDNKDRPDADFEFTVKVTPPGKPLGSNNDRRGVYLREKAETHRVSQYNVTIKPLIKGTEPEKAYDLQLKANLKSSASWISAPDFLHLGGNGRTFEIRVDPTGLSPGLHSAFVRGYDSDKSGHQLFEVPVTVTKPEVPSSPTVRYSTTLKAGSIERHFVHVPEGATWAEARFRSSKHEAPGTAAKFWAHLVTLEPQRRLSQVEQASVLALNEGEPVVKKFSVKGGQTLEVCLAEMWNQAASFGLECELEFHGITIGHAVSGRDELTLIGGEGLAKIEAYSQIRIESLKPSISFSKRRNFVRPTSAVVRPLLSERNAHPSGRQLRELINTYNFSLADTSTVKLSLPTSSPLSNLYDSAVPMLTAVYEAQTKKLVYFGDVYPKDKELSKGEYTVKVQWINEHPSVLNGLKTATLKVDQNLTKGKDVTLSVYDDHVGAFGPAKPTSFKGALKLFPGERKVLNLDLNVPQDSLPKEAQPGDVLIGEFGFAPEGKYELRYIVAPAPKKEDDGSKSTGGKEDEEDEEQLPRLLAPVAKKLKGQQKKDFIASLVQQHPRSLSALVAQLESLDPTKAEDADGVIKAADAVIAQIDVQALMLWLAEKKPPTAEQTDEQKKENKEQGERKKALSSAYVAKTKALLTRGGDGQPNGDFEASFDLTRKLLGDVNEPASWANLRIAHHARRQQPGQALQAVRKLIKDMGVGDSTNKEELAKARDQQRELLETLGWNVWVAYADRWRILENPKDYAPF